jgi:bifunctional non-homologous end joining protein LigD
MSARRDAVNVDVGGHLVRITTPERVLYPRTGFTKAAMLEYYAAVSPAMLPAIADRPISLRRFPEGVEGNTWYQTRCGPNHPAYVTTCVLTVPGGAPQDYCVLHDAAGVLWAANRSTIEFHPLLMRTADVGTPTMVVFDLDPGERVGMLACARVAVVLRDTLDGVGLRSFVKTSGSIGIHVAVPLNTPATFEETKAFARAVASTIRGAMPDLVVDRQAKDLRSGRVLVDWLQNDWRRSTVAPYSLRAAPAPSVSMPLRWEDVERAIATDDERALWFSPRTALERLDAIGDPFAEVETLEQSLAPD